jgi:hypothetical protein
VKLNVISSPVMEFDHAEKGDALYCTYLQYFRESIQLVFKYGSLSWVVDCNVQYVRLVIILFCVMQLWSLPLLLKSSSMKSSCHFIR